MTNAHKNFEFDTNGGDASMLHLISQIDRGIKNKRRELDTEEAKNWRYIWKYSANLRRVALWVYLLITVFE